MPKCYFLLANIFLSLKLNKLSLSKLAIHGILLQKLKITILVPLKASTLSHLNNVTICFKRTFSCKMLLLPTKNGTECKIRIKLYNNPSNNSNIDVVHLLRTLTTTSTTTTATASFFFSPTKMRHTF